MISYKNSQAYSQLVGLVVFTRFRANMACRSTVAVGQNKEPSCGTHLLRKAQFERAAWWVERIAISPRRSGLA